MFLLVSDASSDLTYILLASPIDFSWNWVDFLADSIYFQNMPSFWLRTLPKLQIAC